MGSHICSSWGSSDRRDRRKPFGAARQIHAEGAGVGGVSANGKLIAIGVSFDPLGVSPVQLILGRKALQGWASGTPADEEDTLRFCDLSGVRPMIEALPPEEAHVAYARMMSGKAQFRVVLTM
jgi:D-arabinose 1-dehydrogenase-like Zn-dependent alcohol dehydrogenase